MKKHTNIQRTLFRTLTLLVALLPMGVWGQTNITALSEITDADGHYVITQDIDASGFTTSIASFSGTVTAQAKSDGTYPVISGLNKPLFTTCTNATISNIMLKDVHISQSGYVGAICGTANGTTRIYNCGILPTTNEHSTTGRSTVASTDNHCGSLVGYLDGYARVINSFSYANVAASTANGKNAGGLVGYNTTETQQGNDETNFNKNVKTMVMNCMFYGDITQGNVKRPVYGGKSIANSAEHKTNNYNYYWEEGATFDDDYSAIGNYNYSWPVATKYLVRFEVYRNILNSNRRLCTWWVNGTYNTCPSDADVESVGIAKWVLDRTIAPYPILKKWGKYYSTFDMDTQYVWNPKNKSNVARSNSNAWEGKSYGALSVTIKAGSNNSSAADVTKDITITDMDTLGYDYCARKIQLPYYNEIFGNPNATTWAEKYANNYSTKVVTGWKVTGVDHHGKTAYVADWQDGYNFADRKCTGKDIYDTSGRVFAQGGYYYVPDGVTAITIEAYWGNAVYLCNSNRRLDKVNNGGNDFYNAGQLPEKVGGESNNPAVKTTLSDAMSALSILPSGSVYDQAIVLVGNYQNNSFHSDIQLKGNEYNSKARPFTIMSADFDFDNEPDFCFQVGMNNAGRPYVHPIRFDFLIVPDITMAIRKNSNYWGMRIFCPQGHFEVTETSYIYTTQFEYDIRTGNEYKKHEAPMILNGGEHMQIVSTEAYTEAGDNATATVWADKTSYFLMGGSVYMKAFTPGTHGNRKVSTRHCAVNAIGGEYPEFYLSGMFNANFYNKTDNPHAYLDGGKFGIVAGAGMESVGGKNETEGGDVIFKINHSWIREFYGGGINAQRPVTGNISTTIDNSIVHKYCGGPKLGDMSSTKSITTTATNTVFGQYYGGGNGGTNLLRDRQYDAGAGVDAPTKTDHSHWDNTAKFSAFTPFGYNGSKGYQVEYEFEMLQRTSGNGKVITRSYYHWASFSKTTVAPVTNIITDCTFRGNFYGGGNLGAVGGTVASTLKGKTLVNGSVFGAGFSASIPSFLVHDKGSVQYSYRDFAGFIHDGSLDYNKYTSDDGNHETGDSIYYQWIHDIPSEWGISPSTSNPKFEYPTSSGNWYVYTTEPLTGLGTVSGNVTLTILDESEVKGNVYGGGDESAVSGNTTVILKGDAKVLGNVYGGGNKGQVGGSSEVKIQDATTTP